MEISVKLSRQNHQRIEILLNLEILYFSCGENLGYILH